jgi:hypothetical protein
MSTLNVANITDGTDTVETGYVVNGSAKAWVNFDQFFTNSVRDSFNVSSATDEGVGVVGVSFSSAMSSSSEYLIAVNGEHHEGVQLGFAGFCAPLSTASCGLRSVNITGAYFDNKYVFGLVHGDLA